MAWLVQDALIVGASRHFTSHYIFFLNMKPTPTTQIYPVGLVDLFTKSNTAVRVALYIQPLSDMIIPSGLLCPVLIWYWGRTALLEIEDWEACKYKYKINIDYCCLDFVLCVGRHVSCCTSHWYLPLVTLQSSNII